MSEAAQSIGARLKAARDLKGLSVAKAADGLHLDEWVIEALEGDDFEKIGPAVYAKGHLKRYAELVGLPAGDLLQSYAQRSAAQVAPMEPAILRLPASEAAIGTLPWAAIGAGIAAAVLAVALWSWKPWAQHGTAGRAFAAAVPSSAESRPRVRATAPVTVVETPAIAIPGVATPGVATTTAAMAAAPIEAGSGLGRARLRLSFSADSWVDVHDATGRRLFAGNGRANSVKILAGAAPIRVYLGFASGVQVQVNNHVVAIAPQFVAGDVARFDAGADGVLRRDPRSAATGNPRPRG